MFKFLQRRKHRKYIERLFSTENFPETVTWGSRGSPYLWEAMKQEFLKHPLAKTQAEFKKHLEAVFYRLTLHQISDNAILYCEAFAHGGMSSGIISTEHWRMCLIEILMERFCNLVQST
ncbi:hypothetical protein [Acinetobacter sp. MB5]|uniref:hypothetical protein n=1 Tax=Acinetobacter sp. MB5 TaxID=2069438 RepID=UPI000DD05F5B|nr:hypothetical protein [Acinetobacter sp. MB5]